MHLRTLILALVGIAMPVSARAQTETVTHSPANIVVPNYNSVPFRPFFCV